MQNVYTIKKLKLLYLIGVALLYWSFGTNTVYSQVCDNHLDYFDSASFSNQDGSAMWSSDWVETNDDGTATGGNIIIGNSLLEMSATSDTDCKSISRSADLSTYADATLSIKYDFMSFGGGPDSFDVEVSIDGGNSFTTLGSYNTASVSTFQYYDLTPYMTSNTIIRYTVCGFADTDEVLELEYTDIYACNEEVFVSECGDAVFEWADAAGTGQVWNQDDQANSYTINYTGGSVTVDVNLIDPDNRNNDTDAHTTHPFDPAGGCLPFPGSVSSDDVAGDGSITDPWDSDCVPLYTQTNGVYGPDYLTWGINAEDHTDEVTLEFCFSDPILLEQFDISDIDAQGLGWADQVFVDYEAPGTSFQDEVIVSAVDPYGNNVPVNVEPLGTDLIINGQTAIAIYDSNSDNDHSPNDPDATIRLSTDSAIECLYVTYSNGIDDALDEQAQPDLYAWWSDTYGATNGASDDQAIRLDGFFFCVCPAFDIATVNDTVCIGQDGTVAITSVSGGIPPYTYLWDDGSTNATFTTTPDSTVSLEVAIITDIQGCMDSANLFIMVEDCCPEITGLTDTNTGDVCYDGTPIDIDYVLTTEFGSTPTDYTIVWEVDGVVQADTDSILSLSLSPTDNCTPLASPIVTAKIICTAVGDTSLVYNNTSGGFMIYPTPQATDYTVVDNACTVSITDNCGTLEITNDQGTGSSFTLAQGAPDQVVTFTLKSDPNAPAGCEAMVPLTASCIIFDLALDKTVDASLAAIGDVVTFTVTVTNEGTGDATGVEVTDVLPAGVAYVGGDYTASMGVFDGTTWIIGDMPVGAVETIDIMVTIVDYGVHYNVAEITAMNEPDSDSTPNNGDPSEDDQDPACVSVPIEVCEGEPIDYSLEAPAGYTMYQWYLDGVAITGATSMTYNATEIGEFTYTVDGSTLGDCNGELCCPVIITIVDCCPPTQCVDISVTKKEE